MIHSPSTPFYTYTFVDTSVSGILDSGVSDLPTTSTPPRYGENRAGAFVVVGGGRTAQSRGCGKIFLFSCNLKSATEAA